MCLKKVFAVALTAVFGVVGIVSAQPTGSPVTNGHEPQAKGEMTLSYEVTLEAEMIVTNKALNGAAALMVDPVTQYDNLGTVAIKTNYPKWDVEVMALNGLTLSKGSVTYDSIVPPNFPGGTPTIIPVTIPGTPLLKKGNGLTVGDTAFLQVVVGFGANGLSDWATGGKVDFSTPLKSGDAVSFSEVIGPALTANTNESYNNQTGAEIATDGFVTPTLPPNVANTADANGYVTFYVGAGFDAATRTGGIQGKNLDGLYEETLIFTLFAGF